METTVQMCSKQFLKVSYYTSSTIMAACGQLYAEKYLSFMLRSGPPDLKGCIQYNGSQPRKDGYFSTKFKFPYAKAKKHSLLHHIIYILYHNIYDLDSIKGAEVSHLCSNKSCINVDHLFLESHADNKSRQGCCPPCRHSPECIL